MNNWITIKGIECVTCSEEVESEISTLHTVKSVFNGMHKKLIFVHPKKSITKDEFLNSMNNISEILNDIIDKNYRICYRCTDVQVDVY